MASVGDVLTDLELRVLLMKVQEHIRNLQRTGVTGELDVGVIVYIQANATTIDLFLYSFLQTMINRS